MINQSGSKKVKQADRAIPIVLLLLTVLGLCLSSKLFNRTSAKRVEKTAPVNIVTQQEVQIENHAPDIEREFRSEQSSTAAFPQSTRNSLMPLTAGLFSYDVLRKLGNESTPSSACRSLENINRKQNAPISRENLSKRIEDSVFGESSDPTIESLKPILRFVLKRPALSSVLGYQSDSRVSLGSKEKIQSKYEALIANRKEMERILDQSYLLFMIGRSVELDPSLSRNPNVMNYCNSIEASLSSESDGDFEHQKSTFVDFLSAANIAPDAIGFDPEYKTNLEIEMSEDSYQFNIGWLRQIFFAG